MPTVQEDAVVDPLSFTVMDVTARNTMEIDNVDGFRTAGDVAMSMASLMELPESAPYSLRDDVKAQMLDDEIPVGRQIETGAQLVVIPKANLA